MPNSNGPPKCVGERLRDAGAIREEDLAIALLEQARSGGRLGEILLAHGTVDVWMLSDALAQQVGFDSVGVDDEPVPLLPVERARDWRAVALANGSSPADNGSPIVVAVAEIDHSVFRAVEEYVQRPIQPKLAHEAALDILLAKAYAHDDVTSVTRFLREEASELSAYGTRLSNAQRLTLVAIAAYISLGIPFFPFFMATSWVGAATAFYVFLVLFRIYVVRNGWSANSTIVAPSAEIDELDERGLPIYTILLPVFKEKQETLRELFEGLSNLDYPKQKLDGLMLVEHDDRDTQAAIEALSLPPWVKVLLIPEGGPRTKPKAMLYGLLQARGKYLTVYDAEDKPEPLQLKKAAWALENLDSSVACLQAKLAYYNPRQNLLTRWFSLEYDDWFNLILPGLHRIKAPIPLGGTSNHFRTNVLRETFAWDPYNVTEDADLGLRLARLGRITAMLETTTYEEANSSILGWLRQRSRWIKGYLQTLIVHTRHPLTLYRDLGAKSSVAFFAIFAGAVIVPLVSPIFWSLLALWVISQPSWVAEVFSGWIYYASLMSFVFGVFALIFLGLLTAVDRGHDDHAPQSLLVPIYWLLISAAAYIALFELIVRPYHWHKTEHGLHFAVEKA